MQRFLLFTIIQPRIEQNSLFNVTDELVQWVDFASRDLSCSRLLDFRGKAS